MTERIDSPQIESSQSARLRALFTQPVVAPLLRHRPLSIVLAIVGGLQIGTTLAGFVAFNCPFASVLGIPCPGCGISRGCAALIHFDFLESAKWHLFAPFFLIAVGLFLISIPLKDRFRTRLADVIESFERRTAISAVLLTGLMLYWVFRVVYLHGHYGVLVSPAFHFR